MPLQFNCFLFLLASVFHDSSMSTEDLDSDDDTKLREALLLVSLLKSGNMCLIMKEFNSFFFVHGGWASQRLHVRLLTIYKT